MPSRTVRRKHTVERITEYDKWELLRRPVVGFGAGGAVFVTLAALGGNTIMLLGICLALAASAMLAGRE